MSSSSSDQQQPQQQRLLLQTAQNDLNSLNRVSHKLALTENGDKLQNVLSILLPRLLARIGTNHRNMKQCRDNDNNVDSSALYTTYQQIHTKLIDMLSHIMKRVRHQQVASGDDTTTTSFQLPCHDILQNLLVETKDDDENNATMKLLLPAANVVAADPFTVNLTLAFLTLGVPNLSSSSSDDAERLLPGLLVLLAEYYWKEEQINNNNTAAVVVVPSTARTSQEHQIAHLVLQCIEMSVTGGGGTACAAGGGGGESSNATPGNHALPSSSSSSSSCLDQIRTLIHDNTQVSVALFDLLLDVLLYQPTKAASINSNNNNNNNNNNSNNNNTTMPPPGLSQAGHERLLKSPWTATTTATSTTTSQQEQEQEHDGQRQRRRRRLVDLKLAILDYIAPHKRWSVMSFNNNNNNAAAAAARLLCLLVAATAGDSQYSNVAVVSERAQHILKLHYLDKKNNTIGGGGWNGTTATLLACTLLSLCIGESNADSVLQRAIYMPTTMTMTTDATASGSSGSGSRRHCVDLSSLSLGRSLQLPSSNNNNNSNNNNSLTQEQRQYILSTKRRMLHEKGCASVMKFVATNILEDYSSSSHDSNNNDDDDDDDNNNSMTTLHCIGSLAIAASERWLSTANLVSNVITSSSSSSQRAAPQVAAAQLLNSLVVRVTSMLNTTTTSSNSSTENHEMEAALLLLLLLLAKCLATACSVLSSSSVASSTTSLSSSVSTTTTTAIPTNEGSLTMRDYCYGVICALSRCQKVLGMSPRRGRRRRHEEEGWLFSCGNTAAAGSSSTNNGASVETATLLFRCAANEDEKLRPRAVAALDALLGAYCRLYVKPKESSRGDVIEVVPMDGVDVPNTVASSASLSNPWGAASGDSAPTVSDVKRARTDDPSTILSRNSEGLARALLPLLWSASRPTQAKASRMAAARWAGDLLKAIDLSSACHLLCFLAGDSDVTAASIAREGLGLDQKIGEGYESIGTSEEDDSLPDFGELTTVVFSQSSLGSSRPTFFDFSYNGKAAALRFGLICLFSDIYGGEDSAVASYVNSISTTLCAFRDRQIHGRDSVDLLDECAICLAGCLSNSQFARNMVARGQTPLTLKDMEHLAIESSSSKARRYLAEACGHIYEDSALWISGSNDQIKLGEWILKSGIYRAIKLCESRLTGLHRGQFASGEIHGSSYLGSRCVRAFRLQAIDTFGAEAEDPLVAECWSLANSILEMLSQGLLHADEVIGNALAQGLGIALSFDTMDAPPLDERLYCGTTRALLQLEQALRKFGNGDHADPTRASIIASATGAALAASTSAAGVRGPDEKRDVGPSRLLCVEGLFSLLGSTSFRKDPEIALVTGEALALYADSYSPSTATWNSNVSEWPETFDEELSSNLPPHQQVLYSILRRETKVSSPHKRTSCAPALLAIVSRATKMANENAELASRYLASELLDHLVEVQQAFITLLADPKSKQLARESACLGLAACYGLAKSATISQGGLSGELNDSLLRAFGQTQNFGGSALMETRGQETERRRQEGRERENGESLTEPFGMEGAEVQVGGAAGLNEAALGAYREMAGASLALGRPDILYTLLVLSVSSPIFFSPGFRDRYSASSLLGEGSLMGSRANTSAMRAALRPHLAQLIPRLLRACHDPNKQTREQLGTLWNGLTGGGAEARAAISEHLLTTVDALIEDASNKLWRARVGACGALSEVIVGRSWDELGGGCAILDDDEVMIRTSDSNTPAGIRLLRLWRVAVRALDDVRLAVRESGETLSRSVRALTIRLCDPLGGQDAGTRPSPTNESQKTFVDATAAATTSLRWLVQHGLNQQCAEATGACVSCLLGVIEVVQPMVLEPVLCELIGALLMAMSGLEPGALNYLQVRAAGQDSSGDSYNRLERLRLQLAQSGPIAGALNKCLDIVPLIDPQTQKKVIPQLDSALRGGAGFATRAATADAVSTLCAKCPGAFKYQGSSSGNPTVRLLRALYFASEREHGQAARDKMAHALGNLASVAPGSSVRSLAVRACQRYASATGNNDDPAARRAAAAALRALAVRAGSHMADGGPNDIWRKKILPLAFLGQKDSDSKVAQLWKEVWDEGSAVSTSSTQSTAADVSGNLPEEQLLPYLVDTFVEAMKDVSWARRETACTALVELCDLGILSPLPRALQMSAISAPEQARVKRRAEASRVALNACILLMMKPRIWSGKTSVVKATVKVAGQWSAAVLYGDPRVALGFDSSNTAVCPWAPLVGTCSNHLDDLFLDDAWFRVEHEVSKNDPALSTEVAVAAAEVESDVDGEENIDFTEGDDILESEAGNDEESKMQVDEAMNSPTFSGLCRALLQQGLPGERTRTFLVTPDDELPYRAAALEGLAQLLKSISIEGESKDRESAASEKKMIYRRLAPKLIKLLRESIAPSEEDRQGPPPVVLARSIDCLASAFWEGIGDEPNPEINTENVAELMSMFRQVGGPKQAAWTVREASAQAAASLASQCDPSIFRTHHMLEESIEIASYALKDRKFWRVRLAGLKILLAVVGRARPGVERSSTWAGPSGPKDSYAEVESFLPYKEAILNLARSSFSDSEAKVTSMGSDIAKEMAWWP